MARDSEKAMAMLNRFVAAKKDLLHPRPSEQRRPHLSSLVSDVDEAERWRRQVIRDISKAVSQIQNGALGVGVVRDLNDQINKLLREKKHWERQIKALGGPDYSSAGDSSRVKDADGRYAMRSRGGGGAGADYYYFGVAKDLPGVRELFERKGQEERKRSRAELSRAVDAEYFGLRDDEDGLLERLERKAEKKARTKAEREWREKQEGQQTVAASAVGDAKAGEDDVFGMHVELPSAEEIEKEIIAKKKQELLLKYSKVLPPS